MFVGMHQCKRNFMKYRKAYLPDVNKLRDTTTCVFLPNKYVLCYASTSVCSWREVSQDGSSQEEKLERKRHKTLR